MAKQACILSLFLVLPLIGVLPFEAPAQTSVSGDLFSDDTWESSGSPYVVSGMVTLFPGYTLTIEPGADVRFLDGAGLEIRGFLNAEGTADAPITFRPVGSTPSRGSWIGLHIANDQGGGCSIRFLDISYAETAFRKDSIQGGGPLHISDCTFRDSVRGALGEFGAAVAPPSETVTPIERCLFQNNDYALYQSGNVITDSVFIGNNYGVYLSTRVSISGCRFEDNLVAIYAADGVVEDCLLTGNAIAVQPYFEGVELRNNVITTNGVGVIMGNAGGPPAPVHNNSIYGNAVYDLQLVGPFDVDISSNWWGSTTPCEIEPKILDGYDDGSLGILNYSPILNGDINTSPSLSAVMRCDLTAVPIIGSPGDIIIGAFSFSTGSATGLRSFTYPDAFNLDEIVHDSRIPDDQIRWSFAGGEGRILINGVPPLFNLGSGGATADPLDPPTESRIDLNDNDPRESDSNPRSVTFRNASLSPIGGSTIDPGVDGIIPSQTTTISLFASNGHEFAATNIVVYTAKQTADSLMGGSVIPEASNFFTVQHEDAGKWLGGVSFGSADASAGAGGLCMSAPLLGDNMAIWVSPERYIELRDNAIYRVRFDATTDQTTPDSIPLLFVDYDNFNTSGFGNIYGGSIWILDVDGGAEGIGRPVGRSTFEVYLASNAMQTPQWRGSIDFANSPFAPAADASNDMRLMFRILDIGSGNVFADQDSGTICIGSVTVESIDLDRLHPESTLYDRPIHGATHFAESFPQIGQGGNATIDELNGMAIYGLTLPDDRKTLGPFDLSQPDLNTQLYPVIWEANTLYRGTLKLRAVDAPPMGARSFPHRFGALADPIDLILLSFDTATNELGAMHYTTRGTAGNMEFAASPRRAELTGGQGQAYTAYFYGQNATASVVPNSNRLRLLGDFFNTSVLFGPGTGGDGFAVEQMAIEKLTVSE